MVCSECALPPVFLWILLNISSILACGVCRASERVNERTSERANERTSERTNERKNESRKEELASPFYAVVGCDCVSPCLDGFIYRIDPFVWRYVSTPLRM
jgi:hypothetical protein